MADGRANNGGARAGAGRRKKADAEDLRLLLLKCAPTEKRESILTRLVEDADNPVSFRVRNEARKLLLAYLFGKPVERQEISGELDVNMPSPDELKKKFAERRKQVEALDD